MLQTEERLTARDMLEYLRSGDWHTLRRALAVLHPADIAELMDSVDADEEMVLFRLAGRRKTDVFAYLAPQRQRRILRALDPEQLSSMVSQMPADDRTRLLEALPTEV